MAIIISLIHSFIRLKKYGGTNMFLNVTIRWDVIFIEILIILFVMIVVSLISINILKKCIKAHNLKDWNYIIKHKAVLKQFLRTKKLYNESSYLLAKANFELSNDEEFMLYVEKIGEKFIARKLFLKISYALIKDNDVSYVNDLKHELGLLKDEESKKCFLVCELLCKMKYEKYVCTTEELEMIKPFISGRVNQEFLQ